jgi:serine/threonine protein kinase
VRVLKEHPISTSFYREGIEKESDVLAVQGAIKTFHEIREDEELLLDQVEAIGTVSLMAFNEGTGCEIDVLDSKKEILFKVQILDPESDEIFLIFNHKIMEQEFPGGNKRINQSLKITDKTIEKFLVTEQSAAKNHVKDELSLARESGIRDHLQGVLYVVLPHKVTHVVKQSDGYLFIQQKNYVSFKEGVSPYPIDDPIKPAKQLLQTFLEIHKRGITHNDIKHANLILTQNGEIFVIDWGTAIHKKDENQTLEGAITPMYAPKEVFTEAIFFEKAQEVQKIINLYKCIDVISEKEGLYYEMIEALDLESFGDRLEVLENEITLLREALVKEYAKEIEFIKSHLNNKEAVNKLFGVESVLDQDYMVLSVFASGRTVDGLVSIAENNGKEVTKEEFSCFEPCCLFAKKVEGCVKEQKEKAVIDTSKLLTYEARIKSDTYQIGLILQTLFAIKKPIPAPYDQVIKGFLDQTLSIEEALKMISLHDVVL